MGRKDKKIIQSYLEYQSTQIPMKKDVYIEAIYKQPVKNIIDFEKTLTIEEAIAQQSKNSESVKEKKKNKLFKKKNKIEDIIIDDEDEEECYVNQILNIKKN